MTNLGGLNFTNLETVDASLRLSWIRRVNQQSMGWAEFPYNSNIHKLILYGDIYAYKLSQNIGNRFRADVASSACKLLKQGPKSTTDLHNPPPLWFNSSLEFPFRKEWAKKGYHLIRDISNDDLELLMLTESQEKTLKINHLDYETLKFNYNRSKSNRKNMIKFMGPMIPNILSIIGTTSKGCANTYTST